MSTPKSKKRITLKDVALDANVSRATASLVLRNSPLVAEETRKRVQASMKRLGYVYHRAAASMRSQRSATVGLIVTDITNPFFAELTVGIEGYLEQENYAVLMSNTSEQLSKQNRILDTMQEYQVDGVLLCPVNETSHTTIAALKEAHFPVVLVVRYLYDVDVDYVGVDNVLGARLAVNHLIEQGHKRIAFVGGADSSSARRDRFEGYRQALTANELEVDNSLVLTSPVTREGGYQTVITLLNQPSPPTAVLCYNDIVAFGVMNGLKASGVQIGIEFGVVGFDDLAEAALSDPPLTTVAMSSQKIGEEAARLLLDCIEHPDKPTRRIVLQPDLVVRDSTTA